MKTIKTRIIQLLALFMLSSIGGCDYLKDLLDKKDKIIYTEDSNALQKVLSIPDGKLTKGDMPQPSNTAAAPKIVYSQPSASFNPGTQFQLPFTFTANNAWQYIYVQVEGATNGYIVVRNTASPNVKSGMIVLPISLPINVDYGEFVLIYCIVDSSGNISNWITTIIVLREPLTCADADLSGEEGLTATQVDLGSTGGNVTLEYDTYTVPDRIDIYQGITWLTGTGANTGLLVPPLCQCSSPLPGFIGTKGTKVLSFYYDPAKGRNITIYVSGCLNNNTAWIWHLNCPN